MGDMELKKLSHFQAQGALFKSIAQQNQASNILVVESELHYFLF